MNHSDITVVMVIDLPQAVLYPADPGLRPIELETWETVPDAGKCHLQRRGHAWIGKASEESKRIFLMNVGPRILRVKKVRQPPARSQIAVAMISKRHF